MKKTLQRVSTTEKRIYWKDKDDIRHDGCHQNLSGNASELSGDVSGLFGNVAEICGNVTWISGDVSGISGNVDDAELTDEERRDGVHITDLIDETTNGGSK